MTSHVTKSILSVVLASLLVLPARPAWAGSATNRPAVLFTGAYDPTLDYEIARGLDRDGFAVRALPGQLADRPLTWEDVKPFNVIVLTGVGFANSDMALNADNHQTIATLQRFLAAGGGVFFHPFWQQRNGMIPPQQAFANPLGLTPLFEEVPFDPTNAVRATAYKIDFARTAAITPSPITAGITSLWYPTATRAGMESHVVPFQADASWTVVATGSTSSYTRTVALDKSGVGQAGDPGKFQTRVPLLAYRQVGQGRIVCCGISPTWIHGLPAGNALEGVVRDRGLNGVPSDGAKLLANSLRWLAEPSQTQTNLGGARTDPALLENPYLTKFCEPADWSQEILKPFPAVERACPGVIGPRTTLSGGKSTVEEWVTQAKALGLAYLVFLEDLAELSAAELATLKTECARLTDASFAAVPGFRIQDTVGNHYFYCGANVFYPPPYLLAADGKTFTSYDPDLGLNVQGQLNMTAAIYWYQLGGGNLTAGHYLYRGGAAPFANWFGAFTAVGVVTQRGGQMVEDATQEFLQIVDAGQGPLPIAINLLDDPAELKQTPWRTVLRLQGGDKLVAGTLDTRQPVLDYFNKWHYYPDSPTRIYVTDGPQIDYWSCVGPRDYEGPNRGEFIWQNYRWRVGGKVSSTVGLKEVAVYDGPELFRRFLPQGQKQFEFALDLTHNQQHNFVLIATDVNGHRAISGEQWDRVNRLQEVNCGDRNNQLAGGYETRRDGTAIQIVINPPATSNKRLPELFVDPAGSFNCDRLLGTYAFDGLATGQPFVRLPLTLWPAGGGEIAAPRVGEARRLLHSGDTHIGTAWCDYDFTDGVQAVNVWHTLWRTAPARDFALERRTQFFQIDPDSPLAVFRLQLRVTLKRDLPNRGFQVAWLDPYLATRWAVRGRTGDWLTDTAPATAPAESKENKLAFAPGACAAMLDSPLGSAAIFSLGDGLEATWTTPNPGRINVNLLAANAPQKQGESHTVELLVVGLPRVTRYTESVATNTVATLTRFASDFGLTTNPPGYTVRARTGKVTGQRYILCVDGHAAQAFSGQLRGDLISTLPMVVNGLNDGWSAFLYDRQLKAARPLGVFENQAWATVRLHGQQDLFIGHPVSCDNREVFLQLTQTGDQSWCLEAHNPTAAPLRVTLRFNPCFDPWKSKTLPARKVELPAGWSKSFTL